MKAHKTFHRMVSGWFLPVATGPMGLAVAISIFLTSTKIAGVSRSTWEDGSIQTNGNRNLVYHPIKEIFILQAEGSVAWGAVIFMFRIYNPMENGVNPKT